MKKMNIRDHIINNFKGDDYAELERAIDESIKEQDEEPFQDIKKFTTSIRSGKTMEELAGQITLTNPQKIIDRKNKITKNTCI